MRRSAPLLAVLAAGCATRGPALPSEGARAEVRALEDEFLRELFARRPEEATVMGWPGADHAAVMDRRPAAVAEWERLEDALFSRAKAVDARALHGTPEAVTLGILREALEGSRATRPCRFELWDVSSLGSWAATYASLAEVQPVGTPALAEAAQARLRGLAVLVARESENLREGARRGYVPTRENVERLAADLDRLLATPPPRWPFTRPGERAEDPPLGAALAGIVERELVPATRRYLQVLRAEVLPRARTAPSLLALPEGEVCYRGAVRAHVTLERDPGSIHATGLVRLEAIHAEMRKIGEASFGTGDVPALLRRLREDPGLRFRDADEVMAVTRAAIDRAGAAAPRWFGRVPRAPVRVVPFPEFLRGAAPAERYVPDLSKGSVSGIYFINVFDPGRKPRGEVESTAFHEAIPGHHFQIALALERGEGPRIRKYVLNTGFAEGWALYSERLALEMGIFSSDVYRLGGLASEAFRAARLVVDTGLNVLGWSRQRALDYLVENAGLDPDLAGSEVDRYVAWPGQATAYMLGALEIRALREEAERALGDRFDVRAFHDAVLEDGAVPLPMLRARVARLVEEAGR